MMQLQRRYTSNLQKGGALIQECRTLLSEWVPDESLTHFENRVASKNLLGKASRRRVRDIIKRIFKRRFDPERTPGPEPLHRLIRAGVSIEVVNKILYYHTALSEDLLYDFVTLYLYTKHSEGGFRVTVQETEEFLLGMERTGRLTRRWTPAVRTRVARGLLAACRDFHILEGATRKSFAPVSMPMEAFVYVAYHLKQRVASASKILEHSDWRLFLIDHEAVERHFLSAHQESWLKYHSAGRVVRIDWAYSSLLEVIDAIAERAHSHA
jgi:hypothetical protein